jgi:hypothetical protein
MRSLKIPSLESKSKKHYDACEIILHACFQILKDYVEEEKVSIDIDHEVRFLYDWWNVRSNTAVEDYKIQSKEDGIMLAKLMKIRTQLWI